LGAMSFSVAHSCISLMFILFLLLFCFFFFFFQAEDGIRDPLVTGVQTCALPIFSPEAVDQLPDLRDGERLGQVVVRAVAETEDRSEERRVGKECRSRWSA